MNLTVEAATPRRAADMVFQRLREDIETLKLPPGSRISEAEVAGKLGVSRQPVRDAFNRLGQLGLLLIRPQRATEVRGFSIDEIGNTRFIRLAVELEVIEHACTVWDETMVQALEDCLDGQRAAIASADMDRLQAQDYRFHKLICDFSGHPLAFSVIEQCKRSVDRLCLLSLSDPDEGPILLADHEQIAAALAARSVSDARSATRRHLAQLDKTIDQIRARHPDYFE